MEVRLNYRLTLESREWRLIDIRRDSGLSEWVEENIVRECGAKGYCLLRKEGMESRLE